MKFNGTSWVYVGNEGFSIGEAYSTSLAFSPSGQPCVAYQDWGNSKKATVIKFDGSNWVYWGLPGFSAARADFTSLAFNQSDGTPYLAYTDAGNGNKATVMKYDSVFVGIKEQQKSKFSLYPNPATDKITIELSEAPKETTLSIVNLEGQELITSKITNPKTQINISNLPTGIYFVRITNVGTILAVALVVVPG
jgi:hypothetical protein